MLYVTLREGKLAQKVRIAWGLYMKNPLNKSRVFRSGNDKACRFGVPGTLVSLSYVFFSIFLLQMTVYTVYIYT